MEGKVKNKLDREGEGEKNRDRLGKEDREIEEIERKSLKGGEKKRGKIKKMRVEEEYRDQDEETVIKR